MPDSYNCWPYSEGDGGDNDGGYCRCSSPWTFAQGIPITARAEQPEEIPDPNWKMQATVVIVGFVVFTVLMMAVALSV